MILKTSKELKKLINISILEIKNNQSGTTETPSEEFQRLI